MHLAQKAGLDIRRLDIEVRREYDPATAEMTGHKAVEAEQPVVNVTLVTPTKGLILAGELAGTVLHTAWRENRPGGGWEAENEYGETVSRGHWTMKAAVIVWARTQGLDTRTLKINVHHEYRQTGERDM